MKVWKDKSGKWIDAKEFAQRFSQGVQNVSPVQQARVSMFGQTIIFFGVLFGLIVNVYAHLWWLVVILSGSLLVVSVATLGAYQKLKVLKNMENSFEKIEEVTEGKEGSEVGEVKGGSEDEK